MFSRGGSLLPYVYADARSLLMGSEHPRPSMFSRGGSLLPSVYADARCIDAAVVSPRPVGNDHTPLTPDPGCPADGCLFNLRLDQTEREEFSSRFPEVKVSVQNHPWQPRICSLGTAACCLLVMLTAALLMTPSHSEGQDD